MFSQRKKFYERKSFYGIILALLLAFGFWINQTPAETQGEGQLEGQAISTGEQIPTDNKKTGDDSDGNQDTSSVRNGMSGYNPTDGDTPENGGDDYSEEDSSDTWSDGEGDSVVNGEDMQGPYYLVKEDQGFIKIFTVDDSGDCRLVRTTDISFSLLSESDQKLFRKGVIRQTQDELSDLLQDFES